jgi:hypothetical protein
MPSCPTCGQRIEDAAQILVDARSGIVRRGCAEVSIKTGHSVRILKALLESYPHAVTLRRLTQILYADDERGGPLYPYSVIKVQACNMRPLLQKIGVAIVGVRGGLVLMIDAVQRTEKAA